MSAISVKIFVLISIQCMIVGAGVIGSTNATIIDTECRSDADCKEFEKINQVANTTCFNRQCLCKDADFKTIECLPQKQVLANVIGGKCPCSNIKWSSCVAGFCMCDEDFLSSENRRSCIPKKVPIGSRCENDFQCSKETVFAECTDGTCACKSEFSFHEGTCHSLIAFGKECAAASKCPSILNTICLPPKCFCEPGYVAKFDKTACVPNVGYDDDCLESVQCQHTLGVGAVCEQGKCVCGEDFSKITQQLDGTNETKTFCENRVAYGQMCVLDADCFQSHFNGTEQAMECISEECKCAEGYELDQRDHQFCVKSKNTDVQNTWLDSILSKVSSAFASSSSNRNKSIYYLTAIVCLVSSIISYV